MTVQQLAQLVRQMRHMQREYFKNRDSRSLDAAKRLEREVDRAVADVMSGPQLFDEGAPEGAPGRCTVTNQDETIRFQPGEQP